MNRKWKCLKRTWYPPFPGFFLILLFRGALIDLMAKHIHVIIIGGKTELKICKQMDHPWNLSIGGPKCSQGTKGFAVLCVCLMLIVAKQIRRSSSEGYNLLCFYPVLIALIWSTLPFGGRAPLKACQNDKGHIKRENWYYSTKWKLEDPEKTDKIEYESSVSTS